MHGGTAVVTGGTGALGSLVAHWLLADGQARQVHYHLSLFNVCIVCRPFVQCDDVFLQTFMVRIACFLTAELSLQDGPHPVPGPQRPWHLHRGAGGCRKQQRRCAGVPLSRYGGHSGCAGGTQHRGNDLHVLLTALPAQRALSMLGSSGFNQLLKGVTMAHGVCVPA